MSTVAVDAERAGGHSHAAWKLVKVKYYPFDDPAWRPSPPVRAGSDRLFGVGQKAAQGFCGRSCLHRLAYGPACRKKALAGSEPWDWEKSARNWLPDAARPA